MGAHEQARKARVSERAGCAWTSNPCGRADERKRASWAGGMDERVSKVGGQTGVHEQAGRAGRVRVDKRSQQAGRQM